MEQLAPGREVAYEVVIDGTYYYFVHVHSSLYVCPSLTKTHASFLVDSIYFLLIDSMSSRNLSLIVYCIQHMQEQRIVDLRMVFGWLRAG